MTKAVEEHPHRPATDAGARAFVVTPFSKMARTHAAVTMADAMVAASFASSLFFSLPAADARWPVLRYLIITMLPFSVLSPLIGPLIDRLNGGHRFIVVGSAVGRAILCYLLISQINGESNAFFFLALMVLVGQRSYQVARSALVPTVVNNDRELVQANSKLSVISGLAGFVGVIPAAILMQIGGPEWSVGLAMVTYMVAAALALRIPGGAVADEPADDAERDELRGGTIIMAGSAMAILRACVGFLTMLVAFDFRGGDRPAWQFGLVAGVAVLSQLGGAALAPRVRRFTSEENVLTLAVGLVVVGGLLSLFVGDVAGACILGGSVGMAAGSGKQAFDALVQRDAPDANRGRAFARFETRFQITWVLGSLIPVWITMSATRGFLLVTCMAAFALASYSIARMAYDHRLGTHQTRANAVASRLDDRFSELSGGVKGRISAVPNAAWRRVRSREVSDAELAGALESSDDTVVVDGPDTTVVVEEDELADTVELGDDDEWPEPQWLDSAPRPEDRHLAADSPTAWVPEDEFPWSPLADAPSRSRPGADEAELANPYPWAPDEPPT